MSTQASAAAVLPSGGGADEALSGLEPGGLDGRVGEDVDLGEEKMRCVGWSQPIGDGGPVAALHSFRNIKNLSR